MKLKIIDNFVIKIYQEESLLGSQNDIYKRVALINDFNYNQYNSLLKTTIEKKNGVLKYRQRYIERKQQIIFVKDHFLDLVTTLEYFQDINFVHGDINRKNILYTDYGFKIIDYEPALLQKKEERKQYMVTVPYVSKLDLEEGIITSRTDKLAFYYFILRINKKISSKSIVALCKTLDHQKFIGMNECDFVEMSYMDILDRAYQVI